MKRKLLFTAIAIIVFATATMAQVPSYVPTNGLVGFWPFTGNANDISGNANNGTVNGAILTTDRFGNANSAYSFNGLAITNANASKITVSNINFNNYITSGFTLSYWFTREDSLNSSNRHFLFYQYNGINGLQIEYVLNTLRHSIRTSTANPPEINYNYTFSGIYNNWHHAIYVWSPPNLITYIDGVFVNSQSNTGITNLMSNSSLIFGGQGVSGSYSHSGKIDDIGIWNRVLTQQEITALYQGSNNNNVPAYVPSNGLVGWWPFTGNANDVSGNGNNGTVNGATLTTDRFGNSNCAYSFIGSSSNYITIPDNAAFNTPSGTWSIWIKTTSISGGAFGIMEKGSNLTSNVCINEYQNKIGGGLSWQVNSGAQVSYSNLIVNDGNWHLFIFTWNNGTIKGYFDGIQTTNSGTYPSGLFNLANGKPIKIGRLDDLYWQSYDGLLDDIGIWNRALTQQEITALYQGSNNNNVPSYVPSNGLVGWWPFNGNANDESGNGNNGTVNGATLTTDRNGNSNSAYSFNGTNNKITVADANSLDVTTTATFSLWAQINQMNFDAVSNAYDARLIDKGTPGIDNGYLIDYCSNNINLSTLCTTGSTRIRNIFGANSINYSNCYSGYLNWSHIVVTFNNGIVNLYINNILFGTFTNPTTSIPTNAIPLVFGYQTSGTSNTWLNGKLDDIGIWNRVLTQAEITALYNGCNLSVSNPSNQNVNLGSNAQFITSTSNLSATYQWQTDLGLGFQNISNAGQYNGANNDTLIVSNTQLSNNNQQFRCIVNDGGCKDTSTVATLTIANIGIYESKQNQFKVYPNPATNQINVQINQNLIGSSYLITDQIGKIVLSGKLNAEKSTIEIGDLSGGVYLFSIGNNAKQTFKVIKK